MNITMNILILTSFSEILFPVATIPGSVEKKRHARLAGSIRQAVAGLLKQVLMIRFSH
jgi:hypothetical protein